MRYYLLDQVTSIEVGSEARGRKCITFTDEILHDHFPDYPILPGALLTEGLAQLAGLILEVTFNRDDAREIRRAVLVQIEKMKFHATSSPGDRLDYLAKIDSLLEDAGQVSVEASCDGEVRAKGRLTFSMIKIDSPRVTAQRQEVYRIWTRNIPNCPPLR
jgi:3-hydroxyacyl-[acyl-carrier-protein] dehydratase